MKKQLLTLLIAFTLVLSGCQINSDANATDPQPDTQPSTLNTVSPTEPNGPKYLYDRISFRFDNLDELDNFKAILEQGDDEKISEALSKLPGELDATKEDAARFLEVVQDIPYLDLIDGELGTIHYKKNFLAATGEPKEIIYVVFNASDGSWIRFHYLLSEEPPLTPADVVSSDQNTIIFSNPMVIADGKVKIFSESRKDHPSGVGKMYIWKANFDGKNSWIHHHSMNEEPLDTVAFFENASVLKVYDETE